MLFRLLMGIKKKIGGLEGPHPLQPGQNKFSKAVKSGSQSPLTYRLA